jgi:hypothetical protein
VVVAFLKGRLPSNFEEFGKIFVEMKFSFIFHEQRPRLFLNLGWTSLGGGGVLLVGFLPTSGGSVLNLIVFWIFVSEIVYFRRVKKIDRNKGGWDDFGYIPMYYHS